MSAKPKKPAKVPVEKGPGRGARAASAPIVPPFAEPVAELPKAGHLSPEDMAFDPSCMTCGNPVKWDKPCACCGTVAVRVK